MTYLEFYNKKATAMGQRTSEYDYWRLELSKYDFYIIIRTLKNDIFL